MSHVPRHIREARGGEHLSAGYVNEVTRQVQAVHIDTRQGRFTPWTDLLDGQPKILLPAKITRVEPAELDEGELPPFPSQVLYWAREIGNSDSKVDRQRPVYGRDVHGDEARVWPAAVGDDCFIVRGVDQQGNAYGRLMLLPGSEIVARRRCNGGGVPPPPPQPGPGDFNPYFPSRPRPPAVPPGRPPRNPDPSSNPQAPVN